MKVSATFLHNLLDYASFQNIETSALKNLTSCPNVDLSDTDKMVSARDYLVVFENIIKATSSENCGLSIAAYLNLSSLGLVLEISLSTSSLKQAIYILDNFLKSKFPIVSFTLVEDLDCYSLQLESSVENKEVNKQLLNMVLYIIYRELKLMLPNNLNPMVKLPFSKKEDVSIFFNSEISSGSSHQILLPKSLDELEINTNRVQDIELLLPKFLSMLNQKDKHSNDFTNSVRDMTLNMCNPEIPNLEEVQNQFALGERTFQRRLAAERTSFRNIVNEIKKELSYYLANEKHLKTKDIAYILGYSESSAYLHALKRWKSNEP